MGRDADAVCQVAVWDVANQRQHLIDTWNSLSQNIVDGATDEWRERLRVFVGEKEAILNTWGDM